MTSFFKRARRAIWTYRQPLTRIPSVPSATISDLFLWRSGEQWETYFELTDAASLFGAETDADATPDGPQVEIRLFDSSGQEVARDIVQSPRFKRLRVDISAMAKGCDDEVGTFCVLHAATPPTVTQLGSNLVERGYVSYRYCNASMRSYVHGNLDAICIGKNGELERLAGASVLPREYHLQHELIGKGSYDIAVVNPSGRVQDIACDVLETESGRKTDTLNTKLEPGACHIFTIASDDVGKRVVIRSRLVMARPLIFRIEDKKMDVLHG